MLHAKLLHSVVVLDGARLADTISIPSLLDEDLTVLLHSDVQSPHLSHARSIIGALTSKESVVTTSEQVVDEGKVYNKMLGLHVGVLSVET